MGPNRRLFVFFLGGSLLILFFNLWGRTLENHDYVRYAEVAREMIRSGDWIVPRYNGDIFINKPPLLFWLIALPSQIHGSVTPFLARFPSALFAWIGVIVVYLLGKKIWGEEKYGLISAGTLISSYLFFWQSRIARTDVVFSTLILLSLYFFYLGYFDRISSSPSLPDSRLSKTLLSFIFMGLAGLTKGPVGILFPLLIISLFLLKEKQLRLLLRKDFLLGYLVIVFILGSWIFPFLTRVGWENALKVWRETKILSRHQPFYLYGLKIWIQFAPWSIFFPFLFMYFWKKERSRDEEFLILWFIVLFIFLTLFPYRSSKYLLPAYPPLALLMGGFWRKRSLLLFGALFLGAIVVYHGYEYRAILRNNDQTPGLLLSQELKPYQDYDISGYQIDVDLLGKINFYRDTVIPRMNKVKDLKEKVKGKREVFVMTTEKTLQDLTKEGFFVTLLKKIDFGKENLVLVKIEEL